MYEFIAAILSKQLNKIKSAKDEKEKRKLFFQSLFWIVCSLVSLVIYIPPGLSIFEVLIACEFELPFFVLPFLMLNKKKYVAKKLEESNENYDGSGNQCKITGEFQELNVFNVIKFKIFNQNIWTKTFL